MSYTWKPKTPFDDLPHLPPEDFSNKSISPDLLRAAGEALAELRGYTGNIPTSVNQLLNSIYLEESLFSSKIENINTTLESVLEQQISDEEEGDADQKVINYREAIIWGWTRIQDGHPITQRLIKGLHDRLLPDERAGFRDLQNKIANDTTGEVRYTPPSPQSIGSLLTDWENFVNKKGKIDPLIRTALAHYQFEAIHPFEDGNGRVGRMLIILQLIKDEILRGPSIQISRYINNNRSDYYKLLLKITSDQEWEEFVEFMLIGLKKEANRTRRMLMKLDSESRDISNLVKKKASKIYSAELIESIFVFPIINPTKLAKELDIHYQTASKYLRKLEDMDLLRSYKKGRKKMFINTAVLDIIKDSA